MANKKRSELTVGQFDHLAIRVRNAAENYRMKHFYRRPPHPPEIAAAMKIVDEYHTKETRKIGLQLLALEKEGKNLVQKLLFEEPADALKRVEAFEAKYSTRKKKPVE